MKKFKIGDRVQLVDDHSCSVYTYLLGQIGTVKFNQIDTLISVDFDRSLDLEKISDAHLFEIYEDRFILVGDESIKCRKSK